MGVESVMDGVMGRVIGYWWGGRDEGVAAGEKGGGTVWREYLF